MNIPGFICETARGAGEIVRQHYGHVKTRRLKSDRGDFVTEVDLESESYIIKRIREEFPEDNIISEEAGRLRDIEEGYTWIIDPLDGTRNYAIGIPFFSVSIALTRDGRAEHGAVYDPIHDELFFASRGWGATMNGERIRVSTEPDLEDAVITVAWVRKKVERTQFMGYVEHLSHRTSYFRRLGSAALATAYVAAGRFDAFIQGGLNPWDVAAGIVLVEEAGGLATDLTGRPIDLTRPETDILAANPALHNRLLSEVIRRL
ncbi:MAG: inositol monophosphatase [Armatimonadetes bacterium]|nr:inositol monophosphatase [Armatimonadota bacterium]